MPSICKANTAILAAVVTRPVFTDANGGSVHREKLYLITYTLSECIVVVAVVIVVAAVYDALVVVAATNSW